MRAMRIPTGLMAASYSVLMILTILVVIQNTQAVPITLLFRAFSMPLALLLVLTLFSGAISGIVLYHSLSDRMYRYQRQPHDRAANDRSSETH